MSGFILEEEDAQRIIKELPSMSGVEKYRCLLDPSLISTSLRFHPECNFPLAAVCFSDTLSTLADIRFALSEALANRIWYCEQRSELVPETGIWMEAFYLTDAAIRLYSAAEHLANGIICMLELKNEDLEPFREGRSSQQIIVGKYLAGTKMDSQITKEILKLRDSESWHKIVEIRTDTTHNQPPTIEGMGITYKRKKRWVKSEDGRSYTTGVGGGDEPDITVDEMETHVKKAMEAFIEISEGVIAIYADMLAKNGITLKGNTVTVKIC
jgi:hypothetical protein